jgi:hypothetical protein
VEITAECIAHFKYLRTTLAPQGGWQAVALILKEDVRMSTHPCVKLGAIVEAAEESLGFTIGNTGRITHRAPATSS